MPHGALISGVAGLVSNWQQNSYNMELARYQNAYNTQMWHMQNEYNSPKATMQRLVDAGINPRAYQQIGQFANAPQPQPSAQMSKVSELSAFQSVARQMLENKLLATEIEEKRAKTSLTGIQAFLVSTQEKLAKTNNEKARNSIILDAAKALAQGFENGYDLSPYLEKLTGVAGDLGPYMMMQPVGDRLSSFKQRKEDLDNLNKSLAGIRGEEYYMKKEEREMFSTYGITRGGGTGDTNTMILKLFEFLSDFFK